MREQDSIIKNISLLKNKDVRVIQNIVYHPLLFARHRMADPDDYRPIRIRYFGLFVGKYMRNKETYKRLSYMVKSLKEKPELCNMFVDPDTNKPFFTNDKEARKYINKLFDSNRKQEFDEIYEAIYKAMETT